VEFRTSGGARQAAGQAAGLKRLAAARLNWAHAFAISHRRMAHDLRTLQVELRAVPTTYRAVWGVKIGESFRDAAIVKQISMPQLSAGEVLVQVSTQKRRLSCYFRLCVPPCTPTHSHTLTQKLLVCRLHMPESTVGARPSAPAVSTGLPTTKMPPTGFRWVQVGI